MNCIVYGRFEWSIAANQSKIEDSRSGYDLINT